MHVTDPLLGTDSIPVRPSTLPPEGSGIIVVGTATKDYRIDASDVVANNVHNLATAHGTPPSGPEVTDTDPHDVAIPNVTPTPEPAIELRKSGPSTAVLGETITYRFTVRNVGETTLTNVHITDPLLGTGQIPVAPRHSPSASGESRRCRTPSARKTSSTAAFQTLQPSRGPHRRVRP